MAEVPSLAAIKKAIIEDLRCMGFTDEIIGDLRWHGRFEECLEDKDNDDYSKWLGE